MRILANPALLTANEEIREKLVRPLLQNASREYFYIPAGSDDAPKVQRLSARWLSSTCFFTTSTVHSLRC